MNLLGAIAISVASLGSITTEKPQTQAYITNLVATNLNNSGDDQYTFPLDTLSPQTNYIDDIKQAERDQENQKMELEVLYDGEMVPVKIQGSTVYVGKHVYNFECKYLIFHIQNNIKITNVEERPGGLYIQVKWRKIGGSMFVEYEDMDRYLKHMLAGNKETLKIRNREYVRLIHKK